MIETRLLRSFTLLAEELHFSRAAVRLNIAQPALTRQIQMLEQQVGVQLLCRTQRKVELTEPGRIFLRRSHEILAQINAAEAEARRVALGEEGLLTIGVLHSSTYGILPHVLRSFRSRHSRVRLDLREMTIGAQIEALAKGTLDLGLLRPPVTDESLTVRLLGPQRFVLALPNAHPLAALSRVPLAAVMGEAFILFDSHHSPLLYSRVVAMCERAGFVPEVTQAANQIHTILGLVSAGVGISVVPDVARNLRLPNVALVEIEDNPPPVHMCLSWHRNASSVLLTSMVQTAIEVSDSLEARAAEARP